MVIVVGEMETEIEAGGVWVTVSATGSSRLAVIPQDISAIVIPTTTEEAMVGMAQAFTGILASSDGGFRV